MPIVTATAVFADAKSDDLAKRIEQAMTGAALQAHAEGEADPAIVKKRMLDAREAVKQPKAS